MAPSLRTLLQGVLLVPLTVTAQSSTAHTASLTSTSYRPLFTVPNEATVSSTRQDPLSKLALMAS
jgi:hypothetical protein